ncbi:hypothetical protein BV394_00545 [Brevirhabdus pacifica]|uniref:Uncharacterized protein n=2 Tax=Brevirhabdus pacifica TaxID=1267768 RepID=A0A1U7DEM9_9RHOB|nr:hypothetical protein BV394_00545 [Brevirhabdus pacifica]PJJ87136.1 HupE/UreJ protein [Brevirhabdus pacifica]
MARGTRSSSHLAALLALFTTFWLMCLAGLAAAHELRPAVGDFAIREDTVEWKLRLSAEALLADIDMEGIFDTDEDANAATYDSLRALPAEDIQQRFRAQWERIGKGFVARAAGADLPIELVDIQVPGPGDLSLARDSNIQLRVALPDGAPAVQLGWVAAYGPLVLRQEGPEETAYTGYLTGGELTPPIPRNGSARQSSLRAFAEFVYIGFEHIVPKGLDHILFVLGLFLLSLRLRPLLMQISAFTLAHTVTLALGILGYVNLPAQVVEPLIAASIVYVAVENILMRKLSPWRPALVFGFGLLHGLGFASVLGEIGLDPARFASGLIGFNIGVELGQLAVIAVAWLLLAQPFGHKPWYRRRVTIPASALIALVGAFWFVERVI